MRKLAMTKDSLDFVRKLQAKQFKQVISKILGLMSDPTPADSESLRGYEQYRRTDIGEFRIIYRYNEDSISIALVGLRNDDAVYKQFDRKP